MNLRHYFLQSAYRVSVEFGRMAPSGAEDRLNGQFVFLCPPNLSLARVEELVRQTLLSKDEAIEPRSLYVSSIEHLGAGQQVLPGYIS